MHLLARVPPRRPSGGRVGIWVGGYARAHAHAHAMLYPRCRFVHEVANGAIASFIVRGGGAAVGTVQTVPRLLGSRRHPCESHEHGSAWHRRGMPVGGSKSIAAADSQLARQLAKCKAQLSAWGTPMRLGSGLRLGRARLTARAMIRVRDDVGALPRRLHPSPNPHPAWALVGNTKATTGQQARWTAIASGGTGTSGGGLR